MGCTSCDSVEAADLPPEVRLELEASASRVEDVHGVFQSIQKSLVPMGHRPSGGWSVQIEIKGQLLSIPGTSSHYVFAEVKRLLKLNSVEISDLNIWFNLNLQWLNRAVEKYQTVTLKNLQALIK